MTEKEFETKYQMYSQMLFNIAFGYTKNRFDSEDIIQSVFLKYLDKNKSFKDLNHEKYWLIRITINECKNFLKKPYKQKEVSSEEVINNTPQNDYSDLATLRSFIDKLPYKYKTVIILHYYENLSIDDIAKSLNVSNSSIKKRLERARKKLKEMMEV